MAANVIRELCSGRTPQNVILGRVRIDPVAVLGPRADLTDRHFACPPNVPLFTSALGLEKLNPANAGRGRADENMIPVIAHVPAGLLDNTLIFVGISYNSGSRSRPTVSVATGGFMSIPHITDAADFGALANGEVAWWDLPGRPYGSQEGPHIAVPTSARSVANLPAPQIMRPNIRALCRIKIATVTSMDCAINLKPPQFQ